MRRIVATGLAGLLVLGACSSPPKGTVTDPRAPSSRPEAGQPPADERGTAEPSQVVTWARARIGAPYQWGGTGADGFDCSGLVQAAYSRLGVRLPRTTRDQARRGQMVQRGDIRPGDLVFFGDSPQRINHVGIASGRDRMVHASSSRGVVEESFEENRYFRDRYVFARRITTQTASR